MSTPELTDNQRSALEAVADNTCFVQLSGTLIGLRDLALIESVDPCAEHRCGWRVTEAGRRALGRSSEEAWSPKKGDRVAVQMHVVNIGEDERGRWVRADAVGNPHVFGTFKPNELLPWPERGPEEATSIRDALRDYVPFSKRPRSLALESVAEAAREALALYDETWPRRAGDAPDVAKLRAALAALELTSMETKGGQRA